ncbi:hypothetical protein HAX54_024441, partial [Datura stramonium]|nr:hypothetical protein [Datura stramonium]
TRHLLLFSLLSLGNPLVLADDHVRKQRLELLRSFGEGDDEARLEEPWMRDPIF